MLEAQGLINRYNDRSNRVRAGDSWNGAPIGFLYQIGLYVFGPIDEGQRHFLSHGGLHETKRLVLRDRGEIPRLWLFHLVGTAIVWVPGLNADLRLRIKHPLTVHVLRCQHYGTTFALQGIK
jgi:hypothetical protein